MLGKKKSLYEECTIHIKARKLCGGNNGLLYWSNLKFPI